MNTEMHGKRIVAVYWPDTESEQGRCVKERADGYGLHLSVTYHGDHEEIWIIETLNGQEIARHNPRYVESIVWWAEGKAT